MGLLVQLLASGENPAPALVANLPCILVQRYNRLRLAAVLKRQPKAAGSPVKE